MRKIETSSHSSVKSFLWATSIYVTTYRYSVHIILIVFYSGVSPVQGIKHSEAMHTHPHQWHRCASHMPQSWFSLNSSRLACVSYEKYHLWNTFAIYPLWLYTILLWLEPLAVINLQLICFLVETYTYPIPVFTKVYTSCEPTVFNQTMSLTNVCGEITLPNMVIRTVYI